MDKLIAKSPILLALLVAACGGGGSSGGGGVVTSGVPVNFQPANLARTYPASTAGLGIGGLATTQRIDPSGAGSTVTVTTDSLGNLSAIALNVLTPGGTYANTYSVGFSSLAVAPTLPNLAAGLQAVNTGAIGSLLFATQAPGLSASAYGLWASADTSSTGRVGALATGVETPVGSVPTSGTATYNGNTIGVVVSPAEASVLAGTIALTANFAANTVATTISGIHTDGIASNTMGTLPSLTGTQTITGDKYAGALAGGTLAGTLNGTFYGAAGIQETAGVWSVSGGGTSAIGSYGAH